MNMNVYQKDPKSLLLRAVGHSSSPSSTRASQPSQTSQILHERVGNQFLRWAACGLHL